MENDASTPPQEPSAPQPESTPAPPPFEPDPALIGLLERAQKGAEPG